MSDEWISAAAAHIREQSQRSGARDTHDRQECHVSVRQATLGTTLHASVVGARSHVATMDLLIGGNAAMVGAAPLANTMVDALRDVVRLCSAAGAVPIVRADPDPFLPPEAWDRNVEAWLRDCTDLVARFRATGRFTATLHAYMKRSTPTLTCSFLNERGDDQPIPFEIGGSRSFHRDAAMVSGPVEAFALVSLLLDGVGVPFARLSVG